MVLTENQTEKPRQFLGVKEKTYPCNKSQLAFGAHGIIQRFNFRLHCHRKGEHLVETPRAIRLDRCLHRWASVKSALSHLKGKPTGILSQQNYAFPTKGYFLPPVVWKVLRILNTKPVVGGGCFRAPVRDEKKWKVCHVKTSSARFADGTLQEKKRPEGTLGVSFFEGMLFGLGLKGNQTEL